MKTFLEKEQKIRDKRLLNALNSFSKDSKSFEMIKDFINEEEKRRGIKKWNFDAKIKTSIRYEKLFHILLIYLIIIILPIYSSKKIPSGLRVLEPSVSEIKLIINKTGEIEILDVYMNESSLPSEVIINSKKVDKVYYFYNLTKETNEIILKWNYSLIDCSYMFSGTDIDEIDLSNFDISSVLYMKEMFKFCAAKHIIFPKSIKNSVIDMSSMFAFTRYLEYIDLSGLDTSSVTTMSEMFAFSGIKKIDLSSFNTSLVSDMSSMFYDCENLISLNLSIFNTSSVKNMSSMFYGCINLT